MLTVEYPTQPSQADALERAAEMARQDRDYDHARELARRARDARRQEREREAGVAVWGAR